MVSGPLSSYSRHWSFVFCLVPGLGLWSLLVGPFSLVSGLVLGLGLWFIFVVSLVSGLFLGPGLWFLFTGFLFSLVSGLVLSARWARSQVAQLI